MSKLRENPVREVPMRVATYIVALTVIVFGISFFIEFNMVQTIVFLWLASAVNLICFRLIVKGTENFLAKQEAGLKASMTPNLILRYVLYIAVFVLTFHFGRNLYELVASIVGVSMTSIAIKIDGFLFK